ncbi:hypothetical protein TRVL_03068 [Trypanosoma vivax]|nr:hypothetical protein TRVL_03068 [Trypanosoma vivax]
MLRWTGGSCARATVQKNTTSNANMKGDPTTSVRCVGASASSSGCNRPSRAAHTSRSLTRFINDGARGIRRDSGRNCPLTSRKRCSSPSSARECRKRLNSRSLLLDGGSPCGVDCLALEWSARAAATVPCTTAAIAFGEAREDCENGSCAAGGENDLSGSASLPAPISPLLSTPRTHKLGRPCVPARLESDCQHVGVGEWCGDGVCDECSGSGIEVQALDDLCRDYVADEIPYVGQLNFFAPYSEDTVAACWEADLVERGYVEGGAGHLFHENTCNNSDGSVCALSSTLTLEPVGDWASGNCWAHTIDTQEDFTGSARSMAHDPCRAFYYPDSHASYAVGHPHIGSGFVAPVCVPPTSNVTYDQMWGRASQRYAASSDAYMQHPVVRRGQWLPDSSPSIAVRPVGAVVGNSVNRDDQSGCVGKRRRHAAGVTGSVLSQRYLAFRRRRRGQ